MMIIQDYGTGMITLKDDVSPEMPDILSNEKKIPNPSQDDLSLFSRRFSRRHFCFNLRKNINSQDNFAFNFYFFIYFSLIFFSNMYP